MIAQQVTVIASDDCRLVVRAGIDGAVWSLNGDHFAHAASATDGAVLTRTAVTRELATTIEVASVSRLEVDGSPVAAGPCCGSSPGCID